MKAIRFKPIPIDEYGITDDTPQTTTITTASFLCTFCPIRRKLRLMNGKKIKNSA